MSLVDFIQRSDVNDAKSFCKFAQQEVGIPFPRGKDIAAVIRLGKQFFEIYPDTSWQVLTAVIVWAKDKRVRTATPQGLLSCWRKAWRDGYLPECDPVSLDDRLQQQVSDALKVETDPEWRRHLIASFGQGRMEILKEWNEFRNRPNEFMEINYAKDN